MFRCLSVVLAGIMTITVARAQIVNTVAGNGSPMYLGDGGPGTQASLNDPTSIVLDKSGHLLIADQMNNVIRQLDLASGIITTFPTPSLDWPTGIDVDQYGNVFIADQYNCVIRKWTKSTNTWSVIAGNFSVNPPRPGPATASSLDDPTDVVVDARENVYICDWGSSQVLKVDGVTGNLSVLPTGSLGAPVRLCLDASGNVYIADEANDVVYEYDVTTGAFGTYASGFDGPTGIAFDAAGNLYVAEAYGNEIEMVAATTKLVTWVGGTGAAAFGGDGGPWLKASFNSPRDFAIDPSGIIYIADSHNNRVREVINCRAAVPLQGPATLCTGDTATYRDVDGIGVWVTSNPAILAVDQTGLVTGVTAGSATVTCAPLPGCPVADIATVTVMAGPAHLAPQTFDVCSGDSVLFNPVAGPASYAWNDGTTTGTRYGDVSGIYTVAVTDANACSTVDTFLIAQVYPLPVLSWPPDTILCKDQKVQLTVPAGLPTVRWQDGSNGDAYTVSAPGLYWVHVADQNGCTAADTLTVQRVDMGPPRFLPADTFICRGTTLHLGPSFVFQSYAWSTGSTQPVIDVTAGGDYVLEATDQDGCTWEAGTLVTVVTCKDAIYFPNAFTPNGDGVNEVFKPLVVGTVARYHLVVFDRWGATIFESNDPQNGWDGTRNGAALKAGAYVWFAEYQMAGGPAETTKGTLLLVR